MSALGQRFQVAVGRLLADSERPDTHSLIDPRLCDVEPLKAAIRVSRVTERE
jgi:hypothetical protein